MTQMLDGLVCMERRVKKAFSAWDELVDRVRAFSPDVVILVARKMPRLAECFGFNLDSAGILVSDLAIPYIHHRLLGARVAIVDDVINIGSTVQRASRSAEACGAAAMKVFALGTRDLKCPRLATAECVWQTPLSPREFLELTEFVPSVLRSVAKPFDLEFPILPCRLNAPFRDARNALAWLVSQFGSDAVHSFTSVDPRQQMARFSVDMPGENAGLRKMRLYVNFSDLSCNLVPIEIPPMLSEDALGMPRHQLAKSLLATVVRPLRSAPGGASLWPEEPFVRARLFMRSLDFGLESLNRFSDLISVTSDIPVSLPDLEWLFGPIESLECSPPTESLGAESSPVEEAPGPSASPFADFTRSGSAGRAFLDRVRARLHVESGFDVFVEIINELASSVGAVDVGSYTLGWPYTPEEIESSPYLRLRIGFTFQDLCRLYEELLPHAQESAEASPLHNQVSALLDYAIDEGAVVPTLGRYGGTYYRVYRKGETEARDRATARVLYAWRAYGKPMSKTRASKINAILCFSKEVPQLLVPQTLTRGNAAAIQPSVLDSDGGEITGYLISTGQLEEVTKSAR